MKLAITPWLGPILTSSDDGAKVYESARAAIEMWGDVTLDFAGSDVITTSFLNESVGRLLCGMSRAEFNESVRFEGLDEVDQHLVDAVIANAARHFGARK